MSQHTTIRKLAELVNTPVEKLLEQLAEAATDEIEDVDGMDGERAAALIMEARKHWFE